MSTCRGDRTRELGSLALALGTASPRRAREFVNEELVRHAIDEALTQVAVLLVSELVTNAVEHARSRSLVRVGLLVSPPRIRGEVDDFSPTPPILRHPSVHEPRGRGLRLVAEMAGAWGYELGSGVKTVWFELALPSQ